jgi:hypothetical protein
MEGGGAAAGEAYAWAIENPDNVSCIYAENPVLRSLMSKKPLLENLSSLAKAGVPLVHVCGTLDPFLDSQTRVIEKRYRDLSAQITVIINDRAGHFQPVAKDTETVVNLVLSLLK